MPFWCLGNVIFLAGLREPLVIQDTACKLIVMHCWLFRAPLLLETLPFTAVTSCRYMIAALLEYYV